MSKTDSKTVEFVELVCLSVRALLAAIDSLWDSELEREIYRIEREWEICRDSQHLYGVLYDNLTQERERRADRRMGRATAKTPASSARELRKSKNTAWGTTC